MKFYVICREDRRADGGQGKFVLSSKTFDDYTEAKKWADAIDDSREAKVLVEIEEAVSPRILDMIP